MKYYLFPVLICLSSASCFAQTDTAFFDSSWKKCDARSASYYRIVSKSGGKLTARDYFLHGGLQMEAEISSEDPLVKDGIATFYDDAGKKESQGNFKNNNRMGVWTWWVNDGKDSLVNEYDENGFKQRIWPPSSTSPQKDGVFSYVETMPEFPGGEEAMLKYVGRNVKYPAKAAAENITGRVVVQFVVTKTGSITDVKVVKSVREDLDEAAMQVVRDMPNWKPGVQNKKPVNVFFNLPINFTLSDKKAK